MLNVKYEIGQDCVELMSVECRDLRTSYFIHKKSRLFDDRLFLNCFSGLLELPCEVGLVILVRFQVDLTLPVEVSVFS